MSNILEQSRSTAALEDLKEALVDIGVDVENVNNTADVISAIRSSCVPAGTVLNATIMPGPGIKVTPIDRKGYKISANSDAVLVHDLNEDLTKGTPIQKVLYKIINYMIPGAIATAVRTPYIADIEVFKTERDGMDFYDNKAFGSKGQGRKSGLRPVSWYIKIYTVASVEPLYVCMNDMLQDIKHSFLCDAAHQTERQFDILMQEHLKKYHGKIWESKPGKPSHDWDCDREKPGRPEHKPNHPKPERPELPGEEDDDNDCPICDPEDYEGQEECVGRDECIGHGKPGKHSKHDHHDEHGLDSLSEFIYNLTIPNHK